MIVFPDNKAKTHHSKNLQNQSQCIKKLPKMMCTSRSV